MRVLNKKYWPVSVKLDYDYKKEDDIYIWCNGTFAKDQWRTLGGSTYYFRNPEDAMMFRLRWG
jgi:hypothetical protein